MTSDLKPVEQVRTLMPGGASVPDGSSAEHPINSPRQMRLRRRVNNFFVYRTIRKAIEEFGGGKPVLMAPCGYGWFFPRFRRDGIDVVGVDIRPKTIAYARTAVTPPMSVFQGDVTHLPFTDGQFELIVSNRFLLHFEEGFRAIAFKELARVTKRYLLVHYDTTAFNEVIHNLRGARTPELDLNQVKGYRVHKRKERRVLSDREFMESEGTAAGFTIKKLFPVFPGISQRVYALYEKR